MQTEDLKNKILNSITWKQFPERNGLGGQTVSLSPRGVTLICDEPYCQISISTERSQIGNKEKCMKLFKIILEDYLK